MPESTRALWRTRAVPLFLAVLLGPISSSATAEVFLDCTTDGDTVLHPAPGETVNITVSLDGADTDIYTSAVFRVVFTSPGLVLDDYLFAAPFETGTFLDGSLPGVKSLPLSIQDDTLSGPTWPIETADLLFDNFLISDLASPGDLLELSVSIPSDFPVGESVFVAVVPREIADGGELIDASTGLILELVIEDERPADFNRDGVVNGIDLGLLFANWGRLTAPPADIRSPDLNDDGVVDGIDFGQFLASWG